MQRNIQLQILAIVILIGLAIYFAFPLGEKIKLGLDLKGGMHLVLEAQGEFEDEEARTIAMNHVIKIIRNRVDELGVAEPVIQRSGPNRILVQLPGITDIERARRLIGETALLEFRIVKNIIERVNEEGEKEIEYDLGETLLTGDKLKLAKVGYDQLGKPKVDIQLTDEGGELFEKITGDNVGRQLAIVLDGKVESAPVIKTKISGGRAEITGIRSLQEAKDLALVLRTGALPVEMDIIEERTIGPTLGRDSISSGVRAAIIGAILVLIFMVIYYRFYGLAADLALIIAGILILGALAATKATLTLPGIAGLALTIGMAVDANVIIFERIKEELRSGKTTRAAMHSGHSKAFWTIFDANVTTLLAAAVLFQFGTGPVRGFAVTLSIGVVVSMFTALVVTRLILILFSMFKELESKALLGATSINFMGKIRTAAIVSIIIVAIGLASFFFRGFAYGIDFSGGNLLQLRFDKAVTVGDVRKVLGEFGLEKSVVQRFGGEREIIIRSEELKQEDIEGVTSALNEQIGNSEVLRVETVGPTIGRELQKQSLYAVLVSMAFMLAYIAFRFDFKFGVGAIVALIHDVIIVLVIFSLFRLEISAPIIAILLTIVGYSVNDTIIISDRIRENLRLMRRKPIVEVTNLSLNQTLARTINTVLTTMLPTLSLLFLGGKILQNFALAFAIGLITGTYSSIYVASAIVVWWRNVSERRRKLYKEGPQVRATSR